jgi:hypothetical protein
MTWTIRETTLKAMENQIPWWDFTSLKNGGHQV